MSLQQNVDLLLFQVADMPDMEETTSELSELSNTLTTLGNRLHNEWTRYNNVGRQPMTEELGEQLYSILQRVFSACSEAGLHL